MRKKVYSWQQSNCVFVASCDYIVPCISQQSMGYSVWTTNYVLTPVLLSLG